jgi:hypothetical protein
MLAVLAGAAMATPAVAGVAHVAAAKKGIDPAADGLLKQMTAYLAGLKSFRVDISTVDENTLTTGEKIQRTSDSAVAVQRPDRLSSVPLGAGKGLGLWYDGINMTLACKANNNYTTVAAPPTLDAAIDSMRKQFKIDAPGADLLYSHAYDILMEQVTSGRFIGLETVGGLAANHLAFEGDEVDWQIWIAEGRDPLPLRFVITTKTVRGHPQFSVQMSNWQPGAASPPATFQFQPPPGASAVKSAPDTCGLLPH